MSDAELLAAYRATTWSVRAPEGDWTLRLDAPDPAPAELRSSGIVTAYNPASELRSAAANAAAQAELRARLREADASWLPTLAHGTGPDPDRWSEPGFCVRGMERSRLVALAREFGQNAVVWIDAEGRPTLVSTRPGFCGCAPGETLPDP